MTRNYTADGLEDDLNHDPLYQAQLKRLNDLAHRFNPDLDAEEKRRADIIEGHFVEPKKDDETQAIEDMKYLSYVEGHLDAGGPLTQEIYNRCDEIERRNRRKQGF